jgi:predicted small secreted protein
MYTLAERENMSDLLWDCWLNALDEDSALEYWKAIELNTHYIVRERERRRVRRRQSEAMAAERRRRVRRFERQRMDAKMRYGLVVAILFLILLGLLLSGCQAVGGLCRDIEAAARYGADHIECEQR